jgi:hypothetical protein
MTVFLLYNCYKVVYIIGIAIYLYFCNVIPNARVDLCNAMVSSKNFVGECCCFLV